MRIGIKVGSSLLTNRRGKINKEFINYVCSQIVELIRAGNEVFLVTSGAVASDHHQYRSKNLRAIVGMPKLMSFYLNCFEVYGMEAGLLLLTDQDLLERSIIPQRLLFEAFKNKIAIIINANDGVDDEEIKALALCADNDILFKLVCLLVKVDLAIIGFDKAGIIGPSRRVIRFVKQSEVAQILTYVNGGSGLGYGSKGMKTKIEVSSELVSNGIKVILAPGRQYDFIRRAFAGEKNFGTIFMP